MWELGGLSQGWSGRMCCAGDVVRSVGELGSMLSDERAATDTLDHRATSLLCPNPDYPSTVPKQYAFNFPSQSKPDFSVDDHPVAWRGL